MPREKCLLLVLAIWAGSARADDALDLVRRSIEHDEQNFERLKNYTYQQRIEVKSYDGHGKAKSTESQTNEILILAGRPYERLIAKDDKLLPEKEVHREQQKLDKEFAKRKRLSAQENAELDKERKEERKFLHELPDAFDFRILGEESVSGQSAWMIQADPKPGYRPKDSRAKALSKVRAKFWIDKKDMQWVKMEAEVIDTLSFGLNMLRIAPGGVLSFEQIRVNDDVWLPARFNVKAGARLALMIKARVEIDVTYRDYKKFQSDSRIIAVETQ